MNNDLPHVLRSSIEDFTVHLSDLPVALFISPSDFIINHLPANKDNSRELAIKAKDKGAQKNGSSKVERSF